MAYKKLNYFFFKSRFELPWKRFEITCLKMKQDKAMRIANKMQR